MPIPPGYELIVFRVLAALAPHGRYGGLAIVQSRELELDTYDAPVLRWYASPAAISALAATADAFHVTGMNPPRTELAAARRFLRWLRGTAWPATFESAQRLGGNDAVYAACDCAVAAYYTHR